MSVVSNILHMKSMSHALARASGPARRSVISTPSGSETGLRVSITAGGSDF